jgi:hypothetical protein
MYSCLANSDIYKKLFCTYKVDASKVDRCFARNGSLLIERRKDSRRFIGGPEAYDDPSDRIVGNDAKLS